MDRALGKLKLNTVCREARCPNRTECWSSGTATFLILGASCTRGCSFCAVERCAAPPAPDPEEPERIAEAVKNLDLSHAVITSVTRDDLSDGGAAHFAATIERLKALPSPPTVEVLTPDFNESALLALLKAGLDVFAHNIEVVKRLTPGLRHRLFSYERSLETLRMAKELHPEVVTKSSILLGLGEERAEVEAAMADLYSAGVSILVLGQYLSPGNDSAPVRRYVTPEEFGELYELGISMGFDYVSSGPLVRTSYKAAQALNSSLGCRST